MPQRRFLNLRPPICLVYISCRGNSPTSHIALNSHAKPTDLMGTFRSGPCKEFPTACDVVCTERAPRAHGERKKNNTLVLVTLLRLMLCWNYNMGGSSHTKTVFNHAWPRPRRELISPTLIPTMERSFPTLTPPTRNANKHGAWHLLHALLLFQPQPATNFQRPWHSGKIASQQSLHDRKKKLLEVKHRNLVLAVWSWQHSEEDYLSLGFWVMEE